MGDLSSRRGRIEGMEHRAGSQVIKAIVPLAEMFGYATHMRSSTQGRAEYSMQFARYEEAPRSVAEEIIAKVQGAAAAADGDRPGIERLRAEEQHRWHGLSARGGGCERTPRQRDDCAADWFRSR